VIADQTMLELAGLLKAGLPANQARKQLEPKLAQIDEQHQKYFEVIWALATRLGGSVSSAIETLGATFAAQEKHAREVELAFAGPKATAKLVSFLPLVGLLLAQLMGMNPFSVIFTTPVGFLSVALGAILLIVGRVWTKSILNRSSPSAVDPGFYFQAILVGLNAGLPLPISIGEATAELRNQLGRDPTEIEQEKIANLAQLTQASGASISELISSAATLARASQRHIEAIRIASLSVKLMIPLGLVSLPAFVLTTIAPISISLLSANK